MESDRLAAQAADWKQAYIDIGIEAHVAESHARRAMESATKLLKSIFSVPATIDARLDRTVKLVIENDALFLQSLRSPAPTLAPAYAAAPEPPPPDAPDEEARTAAARNSRRR